MIPELKLAALELAQRAKVAARELLRRDRRQLVLDAADGAGVSWLHRHTEVMTKILRDDGGLAMTVRADPANAEKVRAKFRSRLGGLDVPSH